MDRWDPYNDTHLQGVLGAEQVPTDALRLVGAISLSGDYRGTPSPSNIRFEIYAGSKGRQVNLRSFYSPSKTEEETVVINLLKGSGRDLP
jgi:hypothetical protein